MTERKTLSLRGAAVRKDAAPRQSWNVSETRRARLKEMAPGGQKVGGFKFHRQVVVGSTIVDFACPARWLVVEIAGGANAEVVAIQDKKLADVGIRVLRFSEAQVLEDTDSTVAAILAELQKPFDRRAERAANAAGRPVDPAEAEADQAEDDELFVTDAEEGAE